MPRRVFSPQILVAVLLALVTIPAASGQTQDPRAEQRQAALAAARGNQAVEQCVRAESDIARYEAALTDLRNVGKPGSAPPFNCSGIGASWQEVAPSACCAAFEREKSRNVDAAFNALQSCGLQHRLATRLPAYLAAVDRCLSAAGIPAAGVPPVSSPPTGARGDAWGLVPAFDQVRGLILGSDAFAVMAGGGWQIFDNAGRVRPVPGFLADRLRQGFTVLDDRTWLQAALAGLGAGLTLDDALARMFSGGPGPDRQFAWFGEAFVRDFIPNSSLWTTVGVLYASSEHGTIRGTINGGGDFVYIPAGDMWRVGRRQSGLRLVPAAWRPAAAPPPDAEVRLELVSAVVSGDGGAASIVADVAPNGAAAILVLHGRAQVRETASGRSRTASGGEAVLVWPGVGVSPPIAVGAVRVAAASRPRIRGSIVLQPGEQWSGPLRLDAGVLPIEARLLYEKPAGANYVLEIAVNGRPVVDPVLNKVSPMRYADGRNYRYREPNSAKWLLFYSHDYAANNGPAGGGYEVKTDPGEAYRYVWDVASMLGGNPVAQVQFTNNSNPAVPIELRLLQAESANRYTSATPPPVQPPPPAKPRSGWGGLLDTLKEAAKGPSAEGPHLALYTVPRILGYGDFDYPVVVQLLDGEGRPMYPAAPLTVTVTSSDASIVRMYGASAPGTTSLTLRPPDRSGAGGLSWESIRVAAANHWVAGSATLTATAPGLPAASVTLTTVPTRTSDNRSTAAQTAPAARVGLTVLPPVVETNRRPVIVLDLLDAQGQPTGIDFGPGEWTLSSSNPAVFPTYADSGRTTVRNPVGPGQTQLTVTSKRPGVAGSSATLVVIAPGAPMTTQMGAPQPSIAAAPPPAAAVGTTGRLADFGDPAPSAGRVSNIVTARAVRSGVAIDITDRFTSDVNPIHVWFRVSGFAPSTTLLSRWTYLGGPQPLVIGTADVGLEPANDWATFNYELAPGKRWPAGEYLIEILLGNAVVGRTTFEVVRTN